MCTKYSLKDNPDIFKMFIPRNLSRTELSNEEFSKKFAWCLMTVDSTNCDCAYPKLSEVRMSRKELFMEQLPTRKSSIIKDNNCFMCQGSNTYLPNNITISQFDQRSKSEFSDRVIRKQKSVRFADALGLQLTNIKFIGKRDIEKAPVLSSSAIKDLHLDHNNHLGMQGSKYFSPCFKISSDENVIQLKVLENKICLEKSYIEGMHLFGRILVRNLSFEKNVGIRITFNNWTSFRDIYASYILESSDGIIDKFSFSLAIPRFIVVGSKLEFAAFYLSNDGVTFWDNNDNKNYIFECFAKNMGIVTDDGWLHFL